MFTIDNAGTTWHKIDRCSVSKSRNNWVSLQNFNAWTSKYRIIQIAFKFIIQKNKKTISFKNICHRRHWYFRQPPSLHSTKPSTFRRQNRSPVLLDIRKGMGPLEGPRPKVPPEEVLLLPFPTVLSHLKPLPITAPCSSRLNCSIILWSTLKSSHSILLHIFRTQLLRIYHKPNAWYTSITSHSNRINGSNTYYVKRIYYGSSGY